MTAFSLVVALHLSTTAQGPPARLKLSVWPPPEGDVLRCEAGQERQVGITAFDRAGLETALFDHAPKATASPAGVIEVSVHPSGQIVYVRCVAAGRSEITVQVRGATPASYPVLVAAAADTTGAAPAAGAPATATAADQIPAGGGTGAGGGPGAGVSGSGTAAKVPLWASASSLTDSVITQTGGGGGAPLGASVPRVRVDVAAPLHVTGEVNATRFDIGGQRVLTSDQSSYNLFAGPGAGGAGAGMRNNFFGHGAGGRNTGESNTFIGSSAGGLNTTGSDNTFVGQGAGGGNSTGSRNTFIGANAGPFPPGSTGLTFATAIGAQASVTASDTIALGRYDGSDKVVVYGLGAGGSTHLCHNASKQISACSSSLRYKTDVRPFTPGLSLISRLRPISFGWKGGGARDVGFGAEDVARLDPLFVTYNAAGQVEGVKYDRLSAVLVNAVKEQQRQIEARDARITELERSNSAQTTLLAEQEQRLRRLESLVQSLSGAKPVQ